ncbi:MAG TPA: 4-(cytidine 5'-diphospho)-2-C-methyl-D-erythritol kinase [Planctomycetota bacterium]|nr:4-(cytidine 5'-diphospho)-2-C-methyl-D-erythritol kinase [Planctomycetota bacterium]
MIVAKAKLNLFLEVLGRRPDGYHEIDSVFAEIDLFDTLTIEPAEALSIEVLGRPAPPGPENLAWRAAEALGERVRIRLHKRIPIGGGLGGGSSDAAAVLRALGAGIPKDRLHAIARSLGSDVAFFLSGGTARCRGVGDLVEPLRGPRGRRFLLLVPELHMATAAVYGAAGPLLTGPRRNATVFTRRYLGKGKAPYFNRLQGAAEGLEPRLRAVREKGERMFSRMFTMTGSGSAYFAPLEGGVDAPAVGFEAGGVRVEAMTVATS